MSEFVQTIKEKVIIVGREIYLFISSKLFLKNFGGMAVMVIGVLFLSFWWMKCYTLHGESLQVPSYLNMNILDAVNKANQQNLKVVVNDSIWAANKPAGTVLEQSPKPLSRVKEKRTIYLTITKFAAEEKLLPTLAGNDNYSYYHRRLKQLKINLEIKDKQFNNKLEENTILYLYVDGKKITAQNLKKGIKVPQGATVQAIVTTKGGGRVVIPNLVCKKYSEAEFIIGGSQLSISVIQDGTVKTLDKAYVWKQSPKYSSGASLSVGATIDVYVTKRPPADCN